MLWGLYELDPTPTPYPTPLAGLVALLIKGKTSFQGNFSSSQARAHILEREATVIGWLGGWWPQR